MNEYYTTLAHAVVTCFSWYIGLPVRTNMAGRRQQHVDAIQELARHRVFRDVARRTYERNK